MTGSAAKQGGGASAKQKPLGIFRGRVIEPEITDAAETAQKAVSELVVRAEQGASTTRITWWYPSYEKDSKSSPFTPAMRCVTGSFRGTPPRSVLKHLVDAVTEVYRAKMHVKAQVLIDGHKGTGRPTYAAINSDGSRCKRYHALKGVLDELELKTVFERQIALLSPGDPALDCLRSLVNDVPEFVRLDGEALVHGGRELPASFEDLSRPKGRLRVDFTGPCNCEAMSARGTCMVTRCPCAKALRPCTSDCTCTKDCCLREEGMRTVATWDASGGSEGGAGPTPADSTCPAAPGSPASGSPASGSPASPAGVEPGSATRGAPASGSPAPASPAGQESAVPLTLVAPATGAPAAAAPAAAAPAAAAAPLNRCLLPLCRQTLPLPETSAKRRRAGHAPAAFGYASGYTSDSSFSASATSSEGGAGYTSGSSFSASATSSEGGAGCASDSSFSASPEDVADSAVSPAQPPVVQAPAVQPPAVLPRQRHGDGGMPEAPAKRRKVLVVRCTNGNVGFK